MVIFGVKCRVTKRASRDLYGQEVPGKTHDEKCAVVKLKEVSKHSTVRVDSSATRAGADELTADAVILVRINSGVGIDDLLEVEGVRLRVISRRLRTTVLGKPDHYELGCEID